MKNIIYFGDIDYPGVENTFYGEVEIEGLPIELDLDLSQAHSDEGWEGELSNYLEKIEDCKEKIDKAVQTDYKDEGATLEFIGFYLEEFDEEELAILLDKTDESLSLEERLLQSLELSRILFTPCSDDYAVWYYIVRRELNEESLVVYTDEKGRIESIDWER